MAATREVFKVPGAQAQIFMGALAASFTHSRLPRAQGHERDPRGRHGLARSSPDLRDTRGPRATATAALYPARLEHERLRGHPGHRPDNVGEGRGGLEGSAPAHPESSLPSEQEVAVARSYVVGTLAMDRRTNARQAWYLGRRRAGRRGPRVLLTSTPPTSRR